MFIFLIGVAFAVLIGLYWEHLWKVYDARKLLIAECPGHRLLLDEKSVHNGVPTMRCHLCPFQRPATDEERRGGEQG